MTHILSTPKPWDLVAAGYQDEVVPVFRQFARDAIAAVHLQASDRVIDVATGPGTLHLLMARSVHEVVAIDFSPAMVAQFQSLLQKTPQPNIRVKVGDGQALDEISGSFDVAFSQFGLMFFPDRARGFAEIHRVLKQGGRMAITAWAPIAESPAMLASIGALAAAFPENQPKPSDVRLSDGLDNREVFLREMQAAGFVDVTVKPITHAFPVPSPAAFWHSMCRGSAPIHLMRQGMSEARWKEGEAAAIAHLEASLLPGTKGLSSTALLGFGRKKSL